MLNRVVEKGKSKDNDRSRLSITRPRTGTPTGFVQRSRLDFGLGTSLYTIDMRFFSFIIITSIFHSHPRCAFIYFYYHLFSHLSIRLSLFLSLLILLSHLFSNFYLNFKRNLKLSLIFTSTRSIPT